MKADRERLIEFIDEWIEDVPYSEKNLVGNLADYLISKGVTIPVRCGECKYKGLLSGGQHHCKKFGIAPDAISIRIFHNVEPDHFCGCGERKEE